MRNRQRVAFAPELGCDARMDQFIAAHTDKLHGVLSCFDRVLFRGYLPFFSGAAMSSLLETRQGPRRDVKRFVLTQPSVSAVAHEDHAVRDCYAALGMEDSPNR